MKKIIVLSFQLIIIGLILTGCTPQFCALNCSTPGESPTINKNTMIILAQDGITLMPKGESLVAIIPTDVFFKMNSPTLKSDKLPALTTLAIVLKRYGNASVKVVGYTDSIGSEKTKENLSLARARSVLVYFWSQGLDAEHLYAVGLADSQNVGDSALVDTNSANRRVEVIIHAHCTTCF